MTKKLVIISGIITLAALAAAAVAYFLLGKTNVFDQWNLDVLDDDFDED
ncbi:MAG: hypothetical protein J1F09_02305 [Oscillospiraceae bacterium]|nr:hypothetical protein [Oscillospiraceae bacterium]